MKTIDLLKERFKVYQTRIDLFKLYKMKVINNPHRYTLKLFNNGVKCSFEFYDKDKLVSTLPLWNTRFGNETTRI